MEEALARSPKEGDYFSKLDTIMREWFDYDKDGAIEWTLRMTDRRRIHVLGIVASEWAMEDPVAASEWVMKLPEGKNKDQHLNNVVAIWAEREPDKARNWIEKSSLSLDEKDKLYFRVFCVFIGRKYGIKLPPRRMMSTGAPIDKLGDLNLKR